MYEQRTNVAELPFFLGLLDHLAERACPVPRTIHDRDGQAFRFHDGAYDGAKALALIEFLPGVSVSHPTAAQARAVGAALARVHLAAADYPQTRANGLELAAWRSFATACSAEGLASIHPELAGLVERELARLERGWPQGCPKA